jgi:amphiphysin
MNTVHRQFGKLKRRGGDQANVAMLLNEYEDADKMLTKVCPPLFAQRKRSMWPR